MDYFNHDEIQKIVNTSWKVSKTLKMLNTYEQKSKDFFEKNRCLPEKEWRKSILSRVSEQKEIIISKK